MHLDGTQADGLQHGGGRDLAGRDLLSRGSLTGGVDQPCRVQHHEPELGQLHERVGDHLLDQLLVGQQTSLGEAAFFRPACHRVDRALGHPPDRAHRVMQASPPGQPGLGDAEAMPFLSEHRRRGNRTLS